MASNIPVIVQGNSFSLAIPLQIYYMNGDQMDLQDYTPDPTDNVIVQLKGDRRNYTYTPTINGNVANIDLTGNELADNYSVVVSIVKDNGQRLRSFRTDQFFIVESSDDLTTDDIIQGLEENVIYLNSSIFVAGEDGRGIESIVKTGTSGLVDTYTIYYSDNTTSTFTVTNGAQGEQGVGIAGIAKTSTSGLVDTYTITLSNGNTSTFEVTNGRDGVDLGLATIVNDLTTGGATNVLGAEMGKKLRGLFDILYPIFANGEITWTSGKYFDSTGTLQTSGSFAYCTFKPYLDTITTNANSGGGYFCFWDANDTLLGTTTKTNSSEATISIPSGTAKVGLTCKITGSGAVANPYVKYFYPAQTLEDIITRVATIEGYDIDEIQTALYKVYQDVFVGAPAWTTSKYYKNNGTLAIDGNYSITDVYPIFKTFKTNINTGGGYICFFGSNDAVISYMQKKNNNTETISIPSGTARIGITNEHITQTTPSFTDILPLRTVADIDADVTTLKNKTSNLDAQIVYGVVGDSISTDETNTHADGLAYPRTLAKMLNASLSRQTAAGKEIYSGMITACANISSDADIVTIMLGINDLDEIVGETRELGDINTLINLQLDDATLQNSIMGRYRYAVETLRARLKTNALICCISPVTHYTYDADGASGDYPTALVNLRAQIKQYIRLLGGGNNNYFYIDGKSLLPIDPIYYIGANNVVDVTHPNVEGQALLAKGIYNHLPNINLFLSRK